MEGFQLETSLNFHHDGFRGTIIEIGLWKGNRVAVKYGVKELHVKEGEIMKEIGYHPHIIQLIEQLDDCLIIEAFGNGTTLNTIIEKEEPLKLEIIKRWMLQVCNAVKHMHDKGIIHHDIKSKNVLLHEGNVRLCDFELSIKSENGFYDCGSQGWMAPELTFNDEEEITNKIDIYGLGLLLSRLVNTGRQINIVKYGCPLIIMDLIYNCLNLDPKLRPNINQMLEILNLSDFGPSLLNELLTKTEGIEALQKERDDLLELDIEFE